jgi:hypothetical protein
MLVNAQAESQNIECRDAAKFKETLSTSWYNRRTVLPRSVFGSGANKRLNRAALERLQDVPLSASSAV